MFQNNATKSTKTKRVSKSKRLVSLLLCFVMVMGLVPPLKVFADVFPGWSSSANYGGSNGEWYTSVKPTTDGGYVTVGTSEGSSTNPPWNQGVSNDAIIVKYDANNNWQWANSYDTGNNTVMGDYFEDVAQTPDGGYVAVGSTRKFRGTPQENDAIIAKYDASGNLVWSNIYDSGSEDDFNSVIANSDGSVVVAGMTMGSHSAWGTINTPSGIVVKFDASSNPIGSASAPNNSFRYEGFSDIVRTSNNMYVVTGEPGTFCLNSNMTVSWSDPTIMGICLEALPGGGVLVGANSDLIEIDSAGNVTDTISLNTNALEISPTIDGGYLIYNAQGSTFKLDANYNKVWQSPLSAHNLAGGATEISDGTIVMVGYSNFISTDPPIGNAGGSDAIVLTVNETDLTCSVAPVAPVFGTTPTVTVTATTDNHLSAQNNGFTIEGTEWFRVPFTDTTDYRAVGTDHTDFDNKFTAITNLADKGTLTDPDSSESSQSMTHNGIDKNGKYWYKSVVTDGIYTLVDVECVEIDNFYTQSVVKRKGEEAGNPSNVLYAEEVNTMDNSTPPQDYVTNKVGIALDLDSASILNSTIDGGTTEVLNAGRTTASTTDDVYAQLNIVPKVLLPWWTILPSNIPPAEAVDKVNIDTVTFKYSKDLNYWADITYDSILENTSTPAPGFSMANDLTMESITTPTVVTKSFYSPVPPRIVGAIPIGYKIDRGATLPLVPDINTPSNLVANIADVQHKTPDAPYNITFVYGDPVTGTIIGSVKDATSLVGIPNINVTTSTGQTAVTDANGNYTIGNVPPGTHNVIAVDPTTPAIYNSTYKNGVVVTAGGTTTADLLMERNINHPNPGLNPDPNLTNDYLVMGTVTDQATTFAIPGAQISPGGTYNPTGVTVDSFGNYVTGLFPVNTVVNLTASAGGYISKTSGIPTITQDEILNFSLNQMIPGTGVISGTVTDEMSGLGIPGINVTTTHGESAVTDANGNYSISNVPPGTHNVIATDPSSPVIYNSTFEDGVVVTAGGSTTVNLVMQRNTIHPNPGPNPDPNLTDEYLVRGVVTEDGSNPVVPLVNAEIAPGGIHVDSFGNYVTGLFPENSSVELTASCTGGYVPVTENIPSITQDEVKNFALPIGIGIVVKTQYPWQTNPVVAYTLTVPYGSDHVIYAPYRYNVAPDFRPLHAVSRQLNNDPPIAGAEDVQTQEILDITTSQEVIFRYDEMLPLDIVHDVNIYTTINQAANATSASSLTVKDTENISFPAPLVPGYRVTGYELKTPTDPFDDLNITNIAEMQNVDLVSVTSPQAILFHYAKSDMAITSKVSYDNGLTSSVYDTYIATYGQNFNVPLPKVKNYDPVSYKIDNGAIMDLNGASSVPLTNIQNDTTVMFLLNKNIDGGDGNGNIDEGPEEPDTTIFVTPKPSTTPDIKPVISTDPKPTMPKPTMPEPTEMVDVSEEYSLENDEEGMPELNPDRETFMKVPEKVKVETGEYVDYTLSGIGNPYVATVEDFAIGDNPPEGLTFIEGYIPAFTEGEGLTYSILYETNFEAERVLYEGLDAAEEFTFKAPKLADGEYITGIYLFFDEVPKDFGMGNKITYTFQVTESEVGTKLVNTGFVSFRVFGKEVLLPNEGNSTITVYESLANKPNPATFGKQTSALLLAAVSLVGISSLVLIYKKKRRV